MSARVLLPDFKLPGQTPHPAVRALWGAGALVVVATAILGGALWHRDSVVAAAREANARTLAALSQRKIAEAAPAEAAPTPGPAATHGLAVTPAAAATDTAAPASIGGEPRSHRHAGSRNRTSRSLRRHALAHAAIPGSKKSSSKKDDAVDRLLRGFK